MNKEVLKTSCCPVVSHQRKREMRKLVLQKMNNGITGVVLIPNPDLSESQREVIAQDYCMEYGQIAISVRKALLYYFNKRLRLNVAKTFNDPKETPVVMLNEKAFNDVLAEVS